MKILKLPWSWLKKGWDILRTVYWYNSLAWRILKSCALVFLGLFAYTMGNLVLSYKPNWTFMVFFISYGFFTLIYGPIHHLVVIPGSLYLSHFSWGRAMRVGKRIPFWTLITFFAVVVYVGFYPVDMMKFNFEAVGTGQRADIDPEVICYRRAREASEKVVCQLPALEEIDRVEVENAGRTILTDREPPFVFEVDVGELEEVVGQKNFHVVLRDSQGRMLRRYVRNASMVETKNTSDTAP